MGVAYNTLVLLLLLLLLLPRKSTSQTSSVEYSEDYYDDNNEFHPRCTCLNENLCFDNGTIKTAGDGLLDDRGMFTGTGTDCAQGEKYCCLPGTSSTQFGCGRNLRNEFSEWILQQSNENTYPGEFPWMASILVNKSVEGTENLFLPNIYLCGGVIIHEFMILTAAHCLYNIHNNSNFPDETLSIRTGVWNLLDSNEAFQDRDVVCTISHEKYNPSTLVYDFALLILSDPLDFDNGRVGKICLPEREEDLSQSPECFATGWGKNKIGNDDTMRHILKKMNLPLVGHEECQTKLRTTRLSQFFELDESFICAGGIVGLDTCTGDGGSPLVCKQPGSSVFHLTGLVSWGIDCGTDIPGVYANVGKYVQWITDNLSQLQYNEQ